MKHASSLCCIAAGVATLAVNLALATPGAAQERKVNVVGWGGATQNAKRAAVWQPYTKETGVTVIEDTWNGEIAKVKVQVEAKNVTWDLILADLEHSLAGCEAGVLADIPESIIGDRNDYFPGTIFRCGIGNEVISAVMAYDSARLPAAWNGKLPATIEDSFDTKTFPGKRAIRKRVKNFFEHVLMADGVAPDKIYEEVDKRKGYERFAAKIDSMKKDLLFYDRNEQAIQLLGDGEVAFSSTISGRVYPANQQGKKFVIIWDGQLQAFQTLIVPKGPRQDEAFKLAAYSLRPEVMGRYANAIPYGPARKSALQYVSPEVMPTLGTAPENMAGKKVAVRNEEWWSDHIQEIQEKFNAWLSKL